MSTGSSNAQIPAIQTFQFGASGVGDLQSSVNLFRGDVNFVQQLLSMPGRHPSDNLSLSISLFYQSNIFNDAFIWNRDAPTGAVGLGWSLPIPTIVLEDAGSLAAATRRYSYLDQSISTELAREPTNPFLLSLDASLAAQLADDAAVPPAVVSAFGASGIALSANSVVHAETASQWQIADDDEQQLFELELDGQQLKVFDGGESYQLVNYEFWKVLYYPCYERWVIVKENGLKLSFGGVSANTGQGFATSAGNSVEWGVRWKSGTTSIGTPVALWQGDSALTDSQFQYARAWHLCEVSNPWGDAVSYRYNDWPRLPSGLLPNVEQQVGEGGLPYTKACYLTGMTDVFGRQVLLQYGDKEWSNATPESAREYADPHKSQPDTEPNAYQDRYETLFLQGVTVQDGDETLFEFAFTFQPSRPAGGAGSPVANVTSTTGDLFGDTCKRFLTSITLVNAHGDSLPGLEFDYYFDSSESGASPGALKTVTYTQGGVATYSYTKQSLDICDRTLQVSPPSGTIFDGAMPRVFFGNNYAVVTWYAPAGGALSLQVYTWLGNWRMWQATDDSIIFEDAAGLDISTLDVVARENFFALSFVPGSNSSTTTVYVFQVDNSRPAQWVPALINGVTTGPNTPSLTYPSASGSVVLTGGSSFLLAACTDSVHETTDYDRVTWRWTDATWTRETFSSLPQQAVTALNEYYFLIDLKGNVSLFSLDACLEWSSAVTLQIPDFSAGDPSSISLTPSDTFVAVSNVTGPGTTMVSYTLAIVQWDELYQVATPVQSFAFTDVMDEDFPINTNANVNANGCIAVVGHVLRFNGTTWLQNDGLNVGYAYAGMEQRYAYGPNCAIQIVAYPNGGGGTSALVLSFDPNSDFSGWTRDPVTPEQSLPSPGAETANWPSAGSSDWLTLGQYLYFRNTACQWDDILGLDPCADLQALANEALGGDGQYALNTEAIINEAPSFLAYAVSDTQTINADQVAVTLLQNGAVSLEAQPFAQQRIYTAAEGASGQGTNPAGAGMFVSYPSSAGDFDNAPQIILHSYAGYQVEGNLEHYAVTGITVDNGLGQTSAFSFVPDPATAACDPSGKVFKYYESAVFPGTTDPSAPVFGWTLKRYLNGLTILDGENFYNMLDGQLYQSETYDVNGILLRQVTYDWTVYVTCASSAIDPTAPDINLKGGFLCQTRQTRVEDGVTSVQESNYVDDGFSSPFSGQVVSRATTAYGGTGQLETFTTQTLYAYQMSDVATSAAMLSLHRLTDIAQTVVYWQREGSDPVVAQASARTFAGFASVYGDTVLVPGKTGDFLWDGSGTIPFPFDTYQAGVAPSGWLPSNYQLAYTQYGQSAETRDPMGVAQSTLYGANWKFAIAAFTNASLAEGECAYYGFENYETGAGWIVEGSQTVDGDAHTGTTSLALGANSEGSLSVRITPPNTEQVYVLGFWYKTPSGFAATEGAGFSATVTVDGKAGSPISSDFVDTDGQWSYQTVGIPIAAAQQSAILDIAAANASNDVVLLDDMFISPLHSKAMARVYDPSYQLLTATIDLAGTTTRRNYDAFQRLAAAIGPDEQIKSMSVAFLSRQGSASSAFEAEAPNAQLSISPADGGKLETFLDGDGWQQRWSATGYPDNWNRVGGTLEHTASSSDSLTWRGDAYAGAATTALYFEISTQDALAGPIGVTFGTGYTITFDPSNGFSFEDPGNSSVQDPLGAPPDLPTHWLLVLGEDEVLFLADGQLIFSAAVSFGDTSAVSLSTGPNFLAVKNLAFLATPRMSVAFLDGAGHKCQTHQWLGDDAMVSAVVRDALGRCVAVTRHAPASFGSGASLPLLGYNPGFVNVDAFLQSMQDTWVMSGDVADYYAGQNDGPVNRSDDAGYPYYGYRFEASPRQRRVEQGVPGQPYAVRDLQSTTPESRRTTQIAIGANTAAAFGLPDNYFTQTITNPQKNQLLQLRDTAGRSVAASILDTEGTVSGQSLACEDFSDTGSTTSINEPNSFTSSPQSESSAYVSQLGRDVAGRTAALSDPNSGETSFVFDAANRPRFVQPALDPGNTGFIYYRYDPLGRVVEEGTVAQAWDASTLQAQADVLSWPNGDVPFTVVCSHSYDGDGNDPTQIGRKIEAVTSNQPPSNIDGSQIVTVTETFAYDLCGRVVAVTQDVEGQPSASGSIGYAYNNLDQILRIDYPSSSSPLGSVFYGYDAAARLIAIGSSAAMPTDIASYKYTPDGAVETEARNNGTLVGAFGYASPGWLTSQTVTVAAAGSASFALNYDYLSNGYPQGRTVTMAFDGSQIIQTAFDYDAQGRLVSALVDGASLGSEKVSQYDANGNIWSLIQDSGSSYAFASVDGSDQLSTLSVDGSTKTTFVYDARGNLVDTGTLSLAYDFALNLAQGIAAEDGSFTLRLAYNSFGQRVMKASSTSAQADVTFNGLSRNSLLVSRDGVWSTLVYGPGGLVAAVSDQAYFPLKDAMHSVLAIVDSQNQMAAQFAYRAFGSVASAAGSNQSAVPFRFMGREYDNETGLYNFGARLYSPDLRRFLAADSARETASPYVFVGSNPLIFADPTGNKISTAGQVGIGVAMGLLAVGGLIASLFTFGAAAAPTAAAEGELAADAAIGGVAADVGEVGGEGAEAGGETASSAMRIARNVENFFRLSARSNGWARVYNIATQLSTNTVSGVGVSGLQYDCGPASQFTGKGFGRALEMGAVSGALFGAMSLGFGALPVEKIGSLLLRTLVKVGANAAEGVISNDVTQIVANAIEHQPWAQGLASATWIGAVSGAPFGIGDVLTKDTTEMVSAFSRPGAQAQEARQAFDVASADAARANAMVTSSSLRDFYHERWNIEGARKLMAS